MLDEKQEKLEPMKTYQNLVSSFNQSSFLLNLLGIGYVGSSNPTSRVRNTELKLGISGVIAYSFSIPESHVESIVYLFQ